MRAVRLSDASLCRPSDPDLPPLRARLEAGVAPPLQAAAEC